MSSNGNGNGSSNIVDDLKKIELKEGNIAEISMLALYFVQHIGKASVDDVYQHIIKIHGHINEHILHQAMEGLRARGMLSYARGSNKLGESIQVYKTAKIKWASPPEVAHISNLLPNLITTEEGRNIISLLNEAEQKEGVKKAKNRLGYTDYYELQVRFMLKTPILGSQPDCPYLRNLVSKSPYPYPPYDKGQSILRFWRDEDTGAVMIPSDVIHGWLRTGLRVGFGLADSACHYVAVDDVFINPTHIDQVSLPVISMNKGIGINTYEILPKRTEFTAYFRIPEKGIADPMTFVSWLAAYVPRPIRGLSPARGRRFGKMEVVDYKVLGKSSSIANALESVYSALTDPRAIEINMKLLAHAKQFNSSFKSSAATEAVEAAEEVA
jgi:hypothetical protein